LIDKNLLFAGGSIRNVLYIVKRKISGNVIQSCFALKYLVVKNEGKIMV